MAEGAVLVEFRVSNHRSIREEQIFTTEASSSSKLASSSQSRKVQGHNKNLLPVAAIYGANGSGKSNLLDALAFMQRAVIHSHVHWEAGAEIPRHAFAWDDWLQRDSLLEVTLVEEGVRYVYGFVFDDNVFKEEWLYAYPKGYRQVWFERELKDKEYQYKYGDLFHGKH